jgi:glycosyltransferase involved in cell wall biosynthesis
MNKLRIAVVTSDVPFVEGGHIIIARAIVKALREFGHEAALVLTPQNRFGHQFRAYLATRMTDVGQDGWGRKIDQVISLRFPSFAVKHPNHVCWLNHRLRHYYDLWDELFSSLKWAGKIKERIRKNVIHALDNHFLKHNVNKLFAQSKTIQERLKKWGNIPSEVLYPPPPQRDYRCDAYNNYIFSISRLEKLKRLDLLIDALSYTKNKDLKAYIIGSGSEEMSLSQKIKNLNLENRVHLLGAADEKTILSYYAGCRAVFFAPFQEDYGFVTGEAFSCKKPVITTKDSGGPTELVEHNGSGYVLDPDPRSIAAKCDELAEDQDSSIKMGERGFAFISRLTWRETINQLIRGS